MEPKELVAEISDTTTYTTSEVRTLLQSLAVAIREALGSGRDVHIVGVGKFLNLPQRQRVGGNPRTKERMVIPPSRRVRFEPCFKLKQAIRSSYSVFEADKVENKYTVPEKKEDDNGKVCSSDRQKEVRKRKISRQRFPS